MAEAARNEYTIPPSPVPRVEAIPSARPPATARAVP